MTNKSGVIVVLRDSWVMYGHAEKDAEGRTILTNASVISLWGTTSGLGELAEKGPLENTVLDRIGTVHIEPHDLKFTIECNGAAWSKY